MTKNTAKESGKPELKETRDGSHTLFSHRFNQHYHNPNGAVAESRHNFFETNGLYEALKTDQEIVILEVGFGTGLNLLLLMDALHNSQRSAKVHFYTIEAYPIDAAKAASFNFGSFLSHPELSQKLPSIFSDLSAGMNHFQITDLVGVTVFCGLFNDFHIRDLNARYIFHDAFSPEVNEELWTGTTFEKLKELSSPDVILTTYSAASKAKAALCWAGWKAAKAPGALGKREMTVAALDEKKLKGLQRVNEERLAKRYEQGDF